MHNSGTITGTIDLRTYDKTRDIIRSFLSSDGATKEYTLETENGFSFGAYVDERLFSEEEEIEDNGIPVESLI